MTPASSTSRAVHVRGAKTTTLATTLTAAFAASMEMQPLQVSAGVTFRVSFKFRYYIHFQCISHRPVLIHYGSFPWHNL